MKQNFIACINGQFVADGQASVALADRGFRLGDGAFETIRLEARVPYQWARHTARLREGLAAIHIAMPEVNWLGAAHRLVKENAASDGFIRVSVSRGVGSRGYLPLDSIAPTWAMEYIEASPAPSLPYRLWLSEVAKIPSQCLPANYKLANGLNSTLAALDALKNGCDDALQLTLDGNICETASANVFWVKGNDVFTPSLATNCLRGTTRDAVLRLLPSVHEVEEPLSALEYADAVFITNARLGVQPVATLAPMSWSFNAKHPLIADLQQRLATDRDADRAEFLATFPAWRA